MQRSETVANLNFDPKQKRHTFENYINKPLKASASLFEFEKIVPPRENERSGSNQKNSMLPKLNRYNMQALDSQTAFKPGSNVLLSPELDRRSKTRLNSSASQQSFSKRQS